MLIPLGGQSQRTRTAWHARDPQVSESINQVGTEPDVIVFGPFSTQQDAYSKIQEINQKMGQIFYTSSWQSTIEGEFRVNYEYAENPTLSSRVIDVDYYNGTITSSNERMFPIGLGWRWNIPYIEFKYNKKYLHMEDGDVFEIDGTRLKGHPWEDLVFSEDTSINTPEMRSSYVLKSSRGSIVTLMTKAD